MFALNPPEVDRPPGQTLAFCGKFAIFCKANFPLKSAADDAPFINEASPLDRIGPELLFAEEKQLGNQDQQEAYRRRCDYLSKEIHEVAKAHPFQQNQVRMVQYGENDRVGSVRSPPHADERGRNVVLVRPFLGDQQADHKRPHIGDQGACRSMEPGCLCKIVQTKSEEKAYEGQCGPAETKRKPKNIEEIEIGCHKTVERRHLEEDEHLNKDEKDKTDDIFQQLTHWIFLRVESSSLFCSSY